MSTRLGVVQVLRGCRDGASSWRRMVSVALLAMTAGPPPCVLAHDLLVFAKDRPPGGIWPARCFRYAPKTRSATNGEGGQPNDATRRYQAAVIFGGDRGLRSKEPCK